MPAPPLLLQTPLFAGFSQAELEHLLPQLAPLWQNHARGETLLRTGESASHIGIVLQGEIEAAKFTRGGDEFIVQRMGPGGIFGDVLSAAHSKSPVTVTASRPVRVLLLSNAALFAPPTAHAELHRRLLVNLVSVISGKYFTLDARIDLLLIRSLRRRIAAWLLDASRPHGTHFFTVPFTRTALAAWLGCDRSALSRELSAMAAAGLIETQGRRFRVPSAAALRALF